MRAEPADPLHAIDAPTAPAWACELAPTLEYTRNVPIAPGPHAETRFFRGHNAGLISARVTGVRALAADSLRACVASLYHMVLRALLDRGFPHPVRMWSFIPGIHDHLAPGLDRYRVFNSGRFDAFSSWFRGPAAFARHLPAASALGHHGPDLCVWALGLASPGQPVDNPRQVPAFAYSPAHGPQPPCFARAMLANLPTGPRLLISGTASIRGEDSLHPGSLDQQLEETFENLRRVMLAANGAHRFELGNTDTARVYVSRPADHAALPARIAPRLPAGATVEYVPAMICRAELLVEIEATLVPG